VEHCGEYGAAGNRGDEEARDPPPVRDTVLYGGLILIVRVKLAAEPILWVEVTLRKTNGWNIGSS